MSYNGLINQSRTLDFQALTGAVGAALVIVPEFQDLFTPQHYAYAFIALSVANGYLRSITKTPVGGKS